MRLRLPPAPGARARAAGGRWSETSPGSGRRTVWSSVGPAASSPCPGAEPEAGSESQPQSQIPGSKGSLMSPSTGAPEGSRGPRRLLQLPGARPVPSALSGRQPLLHSLLPMNIVALSPRWLPLLQQTAGGPTQRMTGAAAPPPRVLVGRCTAGPLEESGLTAWSRCPVNVPAAEPRRALALGCTLAGHRK